jgi:uridine kinase
MMVAVVETFAELARRIHSLPPRLGSVRLVAIDGPSAAGKTRFAASLAEALISDARRAAGAPEDEATAAQGSAAPRASAAPQALVAATAPAAAHASAASSGSAAAQASEPARASAAAEPLTMPVSRRPAPAGPVTVVHTDDLLDGWDDQFTFWARLEEQVLDPLRHGRPGRYQRYLWHRRSFGGVPVTVAPSGVVLLEGVSAARAAVWPELSLSVFVTAPAGVRWRRALERHVDAPGAVAPDRVVARAYLERWRAAEDRHFAADSTADHADLLVDGTAQLDEDPTEASDPAREPGRTVTSGSAGTPDPAGRYVRLVARRDES